MFSFSNLSHVSLVVLRQVPKILGCIWHLSGLSSAISKHLFSFPIVFFDLSLVLNFVFYISGAGIDPSSLIIVEGKVCWDIYIDGLVISSDGNILDALGAGIKVGDPLFSYPMRKFTWLSINLCLCINICRSV